MKKLLIFVLIAAGITSCQKLTLEQKLAKAGQCYTCTFGMINGQQPPPQDYCGPMPHNFKDAQGNDLQSFCNKK